MHFHHICVVTHFADCVSGIAVFIMLFFFLFPMVEISYLILRGSEKHFLTNLKLKKDNI